MHHVSNSRSLLCRELIGREDELQELREALRLAAGGQPQLVLLVGEAGSGKTKLCRVFMEESQAQGTLVLYGQAIPQDGALPFGPFLDAFRRYFIALNRSMPPPSHSLHTALTSLLQLFPELASLFPGNSSPAFEPNGTAAVQSKHIIFHGILSALQELARSSRGPLLLVVEDLHWADESSLELLAFLAQRLDINMTPMTPPDHSRAIMILGTYRSEALSDVPALSRLLVRLHSQRHAQEIHLAALTPVEHRRYVSSILEQPISEEFADFLFHWDEGNPFFTEELLGSMAANGQLRWREHAWQVSTGRRPQLPASLMSAILDRFAQLPAADQEVLAYAAVIGRIFDFSLLAALCHLDERELVEVLRRAMHAQLITSVGTTHPEETAAGEQERYQFRHMLTREAIYDQMLTPERRLRHRRVAEQLAQMLAERATGSIVPSPTGFEDIPRLLAEHYWLAGLPQRARPYALQEAERARRIFALREERHYLNMVQTSLPEDSPERLQSLHRMGMLSLGIYDFAEALHWLSLAKTGYQRIGAQRLALQVMANLLFANWFLESQSMPGLLAEVESTAEVVFADPDPAGKDLETLVAASLLAHYWTVHSQYSRSARWIERCSALYESLDDPRKVAAIQLTYITRAWFKAHRFSKDLEEGIAEIRQAIELASQYGLPDVVMMGYVELAWVLIYRGRSDEAAHVLQEAAELEERSGTLLPAFLLGWQHFFAGGQWEVGIRQLRLHIERLARLRASYLAAVSRVVLAHLLLARNELAEAQMQLQTARPALELNNEYMYIAPLWWGLARLYRTQGDAASAQHWYEYALERWKASVDTITISPFLLDGTLFYVDTGHLLKASQWLAELEAVMLVTDNPVGAAALLEARGAIEAAGERLEQAIPILREAVQAWSRLKWRYQQALASLRLAQVLLEWARKAPARTTAQAAREEADSLLDQALAVNEHLQVPTGIEAIKALCTRTHLEAQRKRRTTLEARQSNHGLTEREGQVLVQLVAGRSNREIAAALHISVGTVELHVSHILSKLGCQTRTQAVAHAISAGLVKHQVPS